MQICAIGNSRRQHGGGGLAQADGLQRHWQPARAPAAELIAPNPKRGNAGLELSLQEHGSLKIVFTSSRPFSSSEEILVAFKHWNPTLTCSVPREQLPAADAA